jgi:hypothetical protein
MAKKTCENCIYYCERHDEEEGDCRYYPPKVLQFDEDTLPYADWPVTYYDCWCGKGAWRLENGDLIFWDEYMEQA